MVKLRYYKILRNFLIIISYYCNTNHFKRLFMERELGKKYRKPLIIILSVIILQLIYGFDPKFCIINLIWLLV